jgi:pyruvate dehydrogenase E1 component alpha subunit
LSYGFPGVSIDGNDIVQTHKTTAEAIERARNGEGPTLIEMKTYRWYGHSEIDPADYRTQEELESWKAKDPIPRAEKLLESLGLLTTAKREALAEEFTQEIDEAIASVENDPYADPEEAYNDVYSDAFPVRREEL